jgi:hypothetical protein
MRTEDFILMLATGVEPSPRGALKKRAAWALGLGLLATLVLFHIRYGVRRDIVAMLTVPLFWLKFALALAVALAAAWMTARLARPGRRAAAGWLLAAIPVLIVWGTAAMELEHAAPAARLPSLLGHSWHICTFNIAVLSVPMFVALLWMLRGMAPTQLVHAGAAAGLLSGSFSLFMYSFYCTEMAVEFWSIWYVLGMLIPAFVGALVGRTVLRW